MTGFTKREREKEVIDTLRYLEIGGLDNISASDISNTFEDYKVDGYPRWSRSSRWATKSDIVKILDDLVRKGVVEVEDIKGTPYYFYVGS